MCQREDRIWIWIPGSHSGDTVEQGLNPQMNKMLRQGSPGRRLRVLLLR